MRERPTKVAFSAAYPEFCIRNQPSPRCESQGKGNPLQGFVVKHKNRSGPGQGTTDHGQFVGKDPPPDVTAEAIPAVVRAVS